MIVVADTTPLNYLVQIGEAEILKKLFGRVLLPQAVVRELTSDRAPLIVSAWAKALPKWVEVLSVDTSLMSSFPKLGDGEREAIALALSLGADVVLIDDGPARKYAKEKGLFVAGSLGLLKEAADEGLVDFRNCVTRMRQLGFRMSDRIFEEVLAAHEG